MPILGVRNSLNVVYKNQLREVLDEDKNIYKNVLNREKEQVASWQPIIAQPKNEVQVFQITENVASIVEKFAKFLFKYDNEITEYASDAYYNKGSWKDGYVPPPYSIYEPITLYNELVKNMKSPVLDQQTKNLLQIEITKFLPILDKIIQDLKIIIDEFLTRYSQFIEEESVEYEEIVESLSYPFSSNKQEINKQEVLKTIAEYVTQYAIYKLIRSNINSNIYSIIGIQDVSQIFQKVVIQDFNELKYLRIFKESTIENKNLTAELKIKALNEERLQSGMPPLTEEQIKQIYNQYGKPYVNPILSPTELDMLNKYEKTKMDLFDMTEPTTSRIISNEQHDRKIASIKEARDELELNNARAERIEEHFLRQALDEDPEYNQLKSEYGQLLRMKNTETDPRNMQIIDRNIDQTRKQLQKRYIEFENKFLSNLDQTKNLNQRYAIRKHEARVGEGKKKYIKRKKNNPMEYHDNENDMQQNFIRFE